VEKVSNCHLSSIIFSISSKSVSNNVIIFPSCCRSKRYKFLYNSIVLAFIFIEILKYIYIYIYFSINRKINFLKPFFSIAGDFSLIPMMRGYEICYFLDSDK